MRQISSGCCLENEASGGRGNDSNVLRSTFWKVEKVTRACHVGFLLRLGVALCWSVPEFSVCYIETIQDRT